MAKPTKAHTEDLIASGKLSKEPKQGYRQCPDCEHYVSGGRTKNCPNCGHEFVAKPKSEILTVKKNKSAGPDLDKAAMAYILFQHGGSFVKAITALEKLASDPTMEFAILCGSASEAVEQVKAIAPSDKKSA